MRGEHYLQLGGCIGPRPGQGLAVSAPGGVELDQDPLLVVLDLLPPVGLGQLDHVLAAAGLGVGLAAAAATCLASRLVIDHLPGSGQTSINKALKRVVKDIPGKDQE